MRSFPHFAAGLAMRPALRGFPACRRGVAAMEFAVVAPLFLSILFAIVAFGTSMTSLNAMQSGATMAARSMAIGAATFSGTGVTCGTGVALNAGTAENHACRALPTWGTYTVTATQNCSTLSDSVVITASGSTAMIGDVFGLLNGLVLNAHSVMLREGPCT